LKGERGKTAKSLGCLAVLCLAAIRGPGPVAGGFGGGSGSVKID